MRVIGVRECCMGKKTHHILQHGDFYGRGKPDSMVLFFFFFFRGFKTGKIHDWGQKLKLSRWRDGSDVKSTDCS
jgi:hypothetical protein